MWFNFGCFSSSSSWDIRVWKASRLAGPGPVHQPTRPLCVCKYNTLRFGQIVIIYLNIHKTTQILIYINYLIYKLFKITMWENRSWDKNLLIFQYSSHCKFVFLQISGYFPPDKINLFLKENIVSLRPNTTCTRFLLHVQTLHMLYLHTLRISSHF